MAKKVFCWMMALVLLCSMLPAQAIAEDFTEMDAHILQSGTLNEEAVQWYLLDDGTLWVINSDDQTFSTSIISPSTYSIKDAYMCGNTAYGFLLDTGEFRIIGADEMFSNYDDYCIWGWCKNDITKVIISDGITSVGAYAFYRFQNIEEVVLPNSLKLIDERAFSDCSSLKSIIIPEKVTKIGNGAFQKCTALEYIEIRGIVEQLNSTFAECTALHHVSLANGIREIGYRAFYKCSALESIFLPDSLETIDFMAFSGSGLKEIDIPAGIKELRGFDNCDLLQSVKLHDGLEKIGDSCFRWCDSLTKLDIPATVKELGSYWISECANLKELNVDPASQVFSSVDGVLFNAAQTELVLFPNGRSGDYVAPDSTEKIGEAAFRFSKQIISVTFPEGVSEIGRLAFQDCTSLEQLNLPASLKKVENSAFHACVALKDVYYNGTEAEWNGIDINRDKDYEFFNSDYYDDEGNDRLINADIHYRCVTHQTVIQNSKSATCTEAGYSGDEVCTLCGETVSMGEVIPAAGHDWSAWTVTKAATEAAEGVETRTCSVCAKQEKRSIPKLPPKSTPSAQFKDVQNGAYYSDAVAWAVSKNITNGTSATTFSPDNTCTRGQVVTFLWRAAGEPDPTSTKNPFTDVAADAYYYKAVLWAVEQGITKGTSDTTFSPDAGCTRGQVVTFQHRANKTPDANSKTNPFADVLAGAYYYDAVLWAVEQKITNGTSATTFSPENTCTRGQIVTFLYRDMK